MYLGFEVTVRFIFGTVWKQNAKPFSSSTWCLFNQNDNIEMETVNKFKVLLSNNKLNEIFSN